MGRGGLLTSIILKKLANNNIIPSQVLIEKITTKYPNLTEIVCKKFKIKYSFLETVNSVKTIKTSKKYNPNFVLVASLDKIKKKDILDTSIFFNVHMGVLPHYKGAFTNFWRIKQGHDIFGATIHTMTEKIDSGKVLNIMEKDFSRVINGFEFLLHNYEMAAELVLKTFKKSLFLKTEASKVPTKKGKYYPKFESSDFEINIFDEAKKNYKIINRIQFYGTPFYVLDSKKHYIKHASLIFSGDHHLKINTIKNLDEQTKLIFTNQGILKIKLQSNDFKRT